MASRAHSAVSTPARAALTSRALSVGSPAVTHRPSCWSRWASLHAAPAASVHQSGPPSGTSTSGTAVVGVQGPSRASVPRGVHSSTTVMRFSVSVPVLSVHTTVVLPSVSTTGSRRMIARRCAIRETPIAKVTETAAGRPSGIMPTARATAAVSICATPAPRAMPIAKVTTASTRMAPVSFRLRSASLAVRGVDSTRTPLTSRCTSPSWVVVPVATTMPVAAPDVTCVPDQAMFRRSATGVLPGSTASSFTTGIDSPVSTDSSASSSCSSTSRRSAGTLSPASTCTTSPGTSCSDATCTRTPSRVTSACVRAISLSASSADSARDSWTKPTSAFTTTTPTMTDASTTSPSRPATAPATTST